MPTRAQEGPSGGPITRRRIVDGNMEESCIDFLLTSQKLEQYLESALIDSSQLHALTKYTTTKGNPDVKRSDHFSLIAKFRIDWKDKKTKPEEIFKLRDKDGLNLFHQKTADCPQLRRLQGNDVESICDRWYKTIESILHQCFRKIKITSIPPKRTLDFDIYHSLQAIKTLKEQLQKASGSMHEPVLNVEIDRLEKRLASTQGIRCRKLINDNMKNLMKDGSFSINDAWKLKKKMFPKSSDAPFAVYDKSDNLVTDYGGILDVMKDEFVHQLRNREINYEYVELTQLKEYLCKLRLDITKGNLNKEWTMKDLMKAINRLKNNKYKDPVGS